MDGNGKLQGLLCKGAGFRDCVSKRGRLGDFCCGWRDFAVRRRETKSLRLLPAAKPTSLYKGGLGWLASAGSEALPCGGNGRLRGPLVKGAGFRDCASKRGRLGDFCCGWNGFTVRRWDRNPSGFCLRQNPPPFTREAWVVSQRRWRSFAVWQFGSLFSPSENICRAARKKPPCKCYFLKNFRYFAGFTSSARPKRRLREANHAMALSSSAGSNSGQSVSVK